MKPLFVHFNEAYKFIFNICFLSDFFQGKTFFFIFIYCIKINRKRNIRKLRIKCYINNLLNEVFENPMVLIVSISEQYCLICI